MVTEAGLYLADGRVLQACDAREDGLDDKMVPPAHGAWLAARVRA
jgi:hypothetical protein